MSGAFKYKHPLAAAPRALRRYSNSVYVPRLVGPSVRESHRFGCLDRGRLLRGRQHRGATFAASRSARTAMSRFTPSRCEAAVCERTRHMLL